MNQSDRPKIKDVLNQREIKSDNTRIGHCPWCLAAMSMRNFPISACVVCNNLVNWNIETDK